MAAVVVLITSKLAATVVAAVVVAVGRAAQEPQGQELLVKAQMVQMVAA